MNVAVAMTLLGGLGLLWLWWPAMWDVPANPPTRHEHMRAMDRLGEPRRCPSCRAPLDALGSCCGSCDPFDDWGWGR